jgi:signal transduction histidine kinase
LGSLYYPSERSERLIALGRAALAGFSLLAIWLDPTTPARWAAFTYTALTAYLAYALLLVLLVWVAGRFPGPLGLATHLLDVPIFTAFLYLTEGPASPLFVYFVFALLSAALRWSRRGLLWTAAAALAIFIGLGVSAQVMLPEQEFELNRFIIRSVYLVVVTLLLGYLAAHEERLRAQLSKLAAWSRAAPACGLSIEDTLCHAAAVLGAPRVLLMWDEPEEPWRHLAVYDGTNCRLDREPVTAAGWPVAPALTEADFLCRNPSAPRPTVLRTSAEGLQRWQDVPLDPQLRERLGIGSVLGVRVHGGEMLEGRLLFLDKSDLTSDDLVLGGIIARQVAADLDQFYLYQRLQQTAVAEERARFARELHDGALQTLTGIALRLNSLKRLVTTDPEAACRALEDMQSALAAEQRELRLAVQELKPIPLSWAEPNIGLTDYLGDLAKRIERQWDLRVDLTIAPLARPIPETLAREISRLMQEALANAARHGRATVVRVQLRLQGGAVVLTIADNGRGFAFRGRLDLAALTLRQTGPVSLRGRVAALGGDLVIDSSDAGARLEIVLPLTARRDDSTHARAPETALGR